MLVARDLGQPGGVSRAARTRPYRFGAQRAELDHDASEAGTRASLESIARGRLELVVADLPGGAHATGQLLAGDPAAELARATEGLDLMIAGSRGYGPLRAVLLGAVSERLIRHSACPVVVTPRGVERPLTALFDEPAAPTRRT